MSAVSIACAVGSAICFLTIMVVAAGHFVRDGRVPLGSIVVTLTALAGMLVFAYAIWSAPRESLLPLPLYGLSTALFLWAVRATRKTGLLPAFSDNVPNRLVVDGPYKYVRHPFYVAYFLLFFGNAVATTSWMPWAVLAILIAMYFVAARDEEQKLLRGQSGDAFAAYRDRTGMFVPKIWSRR